MNHEILFRGKRIDNEEWAYGSLQCFKGFSIFDASWKNWISVSGDTVGQYTGLTDKNGVKIFEGDIVDCSKEWWNAAGPAGHDSPILEVEWDEEYSGYDPFIKYDCDCDAYINGENVEIIGNIYDNKELLDNEQ